MKTITSNICLFCNKPTSNPKFCTKSCAASHNNSTTPKRSRQRWYCPICDKPNRKSEAKNFDGCSKCFIKLEDNRIGNMTLEQAIVGASQAKSKYNTVRHHGRKLSHLYDSCQICGYKNFVQVCHIKPIHAFSLDSLVSEINDPSNIAILCPNHHMELDRGFISPSQIPKRA